MNRFDRAELALEVERCKRSAHFLIFDSRRLLTKDEHDPDNPVKPLPIDDLYLRCVLDALLVSGKIIKPTEAKYLLREGYDMAWIEALYYSGLFMIEKSRQLIVTWIVCTYLLWRCKYRPHQLILIQSKREDDAANLVFAKEATVGRMSFMESNLPKHLRTIEFPKGATYGHLYFSTGSHAWAIPEGSDIIRSNTASVIFSDESGFQPEFGNSFTAALPAVKGGGQYIGVSSAEPGEWQMLLEAA